MDDFDKLVQKVERYFPKLPRRVGNLAVEFSHQRFRQQNWINHQTEAWVKRKNNRKGKGRALLVKTGRGRRSIRITKETATSVAVGSDVPYMAAHNQGVNLRKNALVRAHTRKRKGRQPHSVKAHQRTMKINIPQRQFIGESAALNRKIERELAADISKLFR